MMKWISVKDKMPNKNEDIIFSDTYVTYAGYFDGNDFYRYVINLYDHILRETNVMYWMPLPKCNK